MTREEALQAIKEKMDYYESDKRLRGAIETLIPELAESEDERIRKEIIHYLDYTAGGLSSEEQHKWIAYLEKQKEQKHYWKPTETDVALFNKAVTTNKALTPTERTQLDIIRSKFGYCRAINCGGIAQKEQKPAENPFDANETMKMKDRIDEGFTKMMMQEQNPAWSKEDEIRLKETLGLLDEAEDYLNSEHFGFCKDLEYVREWLKSLRPQPKQEWSAKDKMMLCSIQDDLLKEANKSGGERKEKYLQKVQFIEELFSRPKPRWKPSDWQMEALLEAYSCWLNNDETAEIAKRLEVLYSDLNKLKEG